MAFYSNYEKYEMLKVFIQCNENANAASLQYHLQFPERRQPERKAFSR